MTEYYAEYYCIYDNKRKLFACFKQNITDNQHNEVGSVYFTQELNEATLLNTKEDAQNLLTMITDRTYINYNIIDSCLCGVNILKQDIIASLMVCKINMNIM